MSDCRRTAERLTPYVDAALNEQERVDVERHLADCPPCRDEAVCEQAGRAALRQGAERLRGEPLPPGLQTRCEALARTHRGATAAWRQWWPTRLAVVSLIAVVMVFTASALFSVLTHRSDALLAAQLTADHAKCFGLFVGADAPSADAAAIERVLAEQHGWDVHVPPSSPGDDVQLVGGRRCLWADGRLPHIMYRIHGQNASLFVLEGVTREPADVVAFGHRLRIWSRGTTTYVLVSHAADQALGAGTSYVMREAR